ncbi:MAG TPA: HIT family protein [Candidatus Saccharimonadales bacterium]|nr:HIT family protein [Candidatus Saccharimonadales bacterium]
MFNHEPDNFDCPFCEFLKGKETEYNNQNDIVGQNNLATAFVGPLTWASNPGSILIITNSHFENFYSTPEEDLKSIFDLAKQVAIAMRSSYDCSGVTILQRNEPDAGQHVWHLHVHIVPRYKNDGFIENNQTLFVDAETRLPYAHKIRDFLYKQSSANDKQV